MRRIFFCLVLILSTARTWADEPTPGQPGELAGTVTTLDGQPIAGALVDVWTWYPGNETKTDKAGGFHLKGLGDGPVEIRISKEGFTPFYEIKQPTGVGDLAVSLGNKTFFQGTVFSKDGQPVPGATVWADCGPKLLANQMHLTNVWSKTKTDADGHYKLFVAPDSYVIETRVADLGVAQVQMGIGPDEAVIQDIHLEDGIRLVVRCIDGDTNEPVVGAKVTSSKELNLRATSNEKGEAIFEHTLADKFSFEVSCKGYSKWWSSDAANEEVRDRPRNLDLRWEGIEFNVQAEMQPVTIQLEKGITISGHVVDPEGKPVAGATVATAKFGWGDSIDQTQRFTAKSKADGSFSLTLPSSGDDKFDLIAHDGNYNQWRKWANGVTEVMQTQPGENKPDVTIKLTKPGTVKGQVLDTSGQPAANKTVRVMSVDDRDSRYLAPEAQTDKDGNFEIKFVRPGEVQVQLEPFYIRQENGQMQTINAAATVTENQTTEGISLTEK